MNERDDLKHRASRHLYLVEEALSGLSEILIQNDNNLTDVNSIHLSSLIAVIRDRAAEAYDAYDELDTRETKEAWEKMSAGGPYRPDSVEAVIARRPARRGDDTDDSGAARE